MQFVLIDLANPAQLGVIAGSDQLQIFEQPGDDGIEAVAFGELQGQALGERPGADADRLEPVQHGQNAFNHADGSAQPFRDFITPAFEIARLVDEVDQMIADQAVGRFGNRDMQLAAQMIAQRRLIGGVILQPGAAGLRKTRAARAQGEGFIRSGIDGDGIVGEVSQLVRRRSGFVHAGGLGREIRPIGAALDLPRIRYGIDSRPIQTGAVFGDPLVPFDQRILFDFAFKEALQFKIGKLQ